MRSSPARVAAWFARLRALLACVYRRACNPLHFAAWYPLHAMPSVASESSSAAAISSQRSHGRRPRTGLGELVGDVDVHGLGHGGQIIRSAPVRSAHGRPVLRTG